MTSQHTPGPWKKITLDGYTYINPQRPEGECGLIAKMVGTSAYEESANAALIALAPEMAETLRAIPALMDCEAYDPQDVHAMIARVTAFVDCVLVRLPVSQ